MIYGVEFIILVALLYAVYKMTTLSIGMSEEIINHTIDDDKHHNSKILHVLVRVFMIIDMQRFFIMTDIRVMLIWFKMYLIKLIWFTTRPIVVVYSYDNSKRNMVCSTVIYHRNQPGISNKIHVFVSKENLGYVIADMVKHHNRLVETHPDLKIYKEEAIQLHMQIQAQIPFYTFDVVALQPHDQRKYDVYYLDDIFHVIRRSRIEIALLYKLKFYLYDSVYTTLIHHNTNHAHKKQ